MSRLILVLMALLVLGAVIAGALSLVRAAFRATDDTLDPARAGAPLMQKVSFLILVALILYVALWGGA